MTPATVLKEEHAGVGIMLGILERICDRLQEGTYPDPGHIERILEFLKVFVDTCHHGKEEDFLFPGIAEAGGREERELVASLLSDHRNGRSFIRGMEEAFPAARKGDGPAVNRFVGNARKYIALLRSHIDREDRELLPRVDAVLGKERQEALVGEFERIEEERIGRGKHEEFHLLMDRLREIYPA
ncbi:MAG: hemerythrin domain-containing protein [Thermodesulfobacteriota bacterium]